MKQQNVRQARTLKVYARIAFARVRTVCMLSGWRTITKLKMNLSYFSEIKYFSESDVLNSLGEK